MYDRKEPLPSNTWNREAHPCGCWWVTLTDEDGHSVPSYLNPAVAPIGHDDVPVDIDSNTGGSVELAVSFPIGTKFEEQVPLRGEDLRREDSDLVESAGPAWWVGAGLTFTEWLWKSVTMTSLFLFTAAK